MIVAGQDEQQRSSRTRWSLIGLTILSDMEMTIIRHHCHHNMPHGRVWSQVRRVAPDQFYIPCVIPGQSVNFWVDCFLSGILVYKVEHCRLTVVWYIVLKTSLCYLNCVFSDSGYDVFHRSCFLLSTDVLHCVHCYRSTTETLSDATVISHV